MGEAAGAVWAVILAAGEGSRLLPLTRALYGHDLPKQFAALDGERTFLQHTLDRLEGVVPPERTVVAVSERFASVARAQLEPYPGVQIVVQPTSRGTAVGMILPLVHVLLRDRTARVILLPSDHYIRHAEPLRQALRDALAASDSAPSGVALVGAEADHPATDFGWILAGAPLPGGVGLQVKGFVEKPNDVIARGLLGEGALWSTMITAGRALAFWQLLRQHLPSHAHAFTAFLDEGVSLGAAAPPEGMYADLEVADFSKHVLQRTPGLAVVRLSDAGWCDCGTPARLYECLVGTPALAALDARLPMPLRRYARGETTTARRRADA